MNHAIEAARERTAVDVVNAVILLLQLETKRYCQNRDSAWTWTETLTPHGKSLCKDTFKKVDDYRLYDITITDGGDRWSCRVVRTNTNERKCWFMKTPVMGSLFGGCTCGAPITGGLPCHHMVAVVKSSRFVGLNTINAMPMWWTTAMWRKQYPKDVIVKSDFDMSYLRAHHTVEPTKRYCPPYSAPNKLGRPKKEKRVKNYLEGNQKKRKKSIVESMESEQKKKKASKTKSGGSGGKQVG